MNPEALKSSNSISTLNEKSLHADLKAWYAEPGDKFEVCVDGFIVDIVRGDLLVEVQTRNFSAIGSKLGRLADHHRVRLVYPIAVAKWIVKQPQNGLVRLSRRKSPKTGRAEHVFMELVGIPQLLSHANFSLEILLIHEEEVRRPNTKRGWHQKEWLTHERRLLQVLERRLFETPAELGALLPGALAGNFSTADLASALSIPRWLAQKMTYCLRELGAICTAGKTGHAMIYKRTG